jgi:Ca2+-transporting ATPase
MVHIPLVVTAALVPFAGYPLLYLPIHIVWFELIIHPTALLAFQELPTGRLRPIAPHRNTSFFASSDWIMIAVVGITVTALVTGGYVWSLGDDGNVAHARAMALAVLTLSSAAIAATLSRLRTKAARVLVVTTAGLSLALIQTPALAGRLHLMPLHSDDLGVAVVGSTLAAIMLFLFPSALFPHKPPRKLPRQGHEA